jgi:hypothetical protein
MHSCTPWNYRSAMASACAARAKLLRNATGVRHGLEGTVANRFLAYARSIGIDPTYEEFERALKGLVSPRRRSRRM